MKYLLCLFFLLVMGSGSAQNTLPPNQAKDEATSKLIIYRDGDSMWGGTYPMILIDKKEVGMLGRYSFFEIEMAPGTYTVQAFFDQNPNGVIVNMVANKNQYIFVESLRINWLLARPKVHPPTDKIPDAVSSAITLKNKYKFSNGSVNLLIGDENKKSTSVPSLPTVSVPSTQLVTNNAEIEKLRFESEVLRQKQRQLELQLAAVEQAPINFAKSLNAHALVIGNSSYGGSSKLANPVKDARSMSEKLRGLGFAVTEALDTDRNKLVNALSQFSRTAVNADITLLFYAGHGVQITGTNYMIPIDLNLNDLAQAPLQGISLNDVVEKYLPGKTKLVFLDACRDNPLMQVASRSVSRGLAPINVSEGTLISYATKDGSVAQDGDGNNSPFTTALLEHLGDPDDIAVVLRKVRDKVMKSTGGKQQPWEYGSLTGGALVLSAIKPK